MIASALMIPLKAKELKSFKLDFKIAHFVKNFYLAGVSQIINESWNTISNQIIKLVKSLADLGTFSLASKLSNVFSVISYSIYTVILTSNAKRKRDDLSYNIKESLILGTFLLALASLGTIISPFFFKILFSQAFASIHKFLDNYFFVEEKSNVLFSLTNFKLFVFVGLSVLLTFNYGLIGIASADLISSVLLTVITFIYIINKSRKA